MMTNKNSDLKNEEIRGEKMNSTYIQGSVYNEVWVKEERSEGRYENF